MLQHGVHGQPLAVFLAILGAVAHIQNLVIVALVLFVDLVAEVDAAFGQNIREPIHGLAALIGPDLCQTTAGVALTPVAQVAHGVLLAYVIAVLLLLLGAAGCQRIPDAAGHIMTKLLDEDGLGTSLGGSGGSKSTGRTGTHHQNLAVHSLLDIALGDLRCLTQPVGGRGGFLGGLLCRVDGTAAGLLDAVCHSVLHGLAGDGCTGHAVDLAGLGVHDLLNELVLGCNADALGLAGEVQFHLGDGVGIKGDSGGDLAHALGSSGVGAGGVDTGCTGNAGGATGCIAGSQTGSGDTAHGSSCCDLQKSFTGDLFHHNSFLFLLVSSYRQKSIAVLVKSITFTNKEKEDIISL